MIVLFSYSDKILHNFNFAEIVLLEQSHRIWYQHQNTTTYILVLYMTSKKVKEEFTESKFNII